MNKKEKLIFTRIAAVTFLTVFLTWGGMTVFAQPMFPSLSSILKAPMPEINLPSPGDFLNSYTEFFQKAADTDLFGWGPAFRLEWLLPRTKSAERYSFQDSFVEGVRARMFVFREVQRYEDDEPVSRFSGSDDISILHGLPAYLRRDGINENLVRLIEEEINLVNYYLTKARDEHGLVLPSGDLLQLAVPPGYSPLVFQWNFISTLIKLASTESQS